MKIIRWGAPREEVFGVKDGAVIRDLSSLDRLSDKQALSPAWFAEIATTDLTALPAVPEDARIGPCISRPPKFIGIGLNYSDHAAETGMDAPTEPIVFMKAPNCISGPFDTVTIPEATKELDWEIELGVVIGAPGYQIEKEKALEHVAGYCIVNDLSARDWQFKGTGQWVKAKSFPGAGPVGPWLVTPDEIDDIHDLSLTLSVDNDLRQEGNSRTMIFDVPTLISTVSGFMALEVGDIIATGTPPGVGFGRTPQVFLKAGQTMRGTITGLGEQVITFTR